MSLNCSGIIYTKQSINCSLTTLTFENTVTVSVDYGDGTQNDSFLMNDNAITLNKSYAKSGVYTFRPKIVGHLVNLSFEINVQPLEIFRLQCDLVGQTGEYVNCLIIDVMSNANVGILIDFGDGEQRLLYLVNADIPVQKIYATSGSMVIVAKSIDKYLNNEIKNATVEITGSKLFQFIEYLYLFSLKYVLPRSFMLQTHSNNR